jgi:hypothetical protein
LDLPATLAAFPPDAPDGAGTGKEQQGGGEGGGVKGDRLGERKGNHGMVAPRVSRGSSRFTSNPQE